MESFNRKSDPIQGILFKTEPIHLQSRAQARAKNQKFNKGIKFFTHLPSIKSPAKRLRRFPKPITIRPVQDIVKRDNKDSTLFNDEL